LLELERLKQIEPQVIKIAETGLCLEGVQRMAEVYGAQDWLKQSRQLQPNDSEFLIELAGRSCYRSFGVGLNPNVTRVRDNPRDYLQNVLEKGDGSILEHATVTFAFLNVSRVFTHEIVRHRAGTAMCLPGETLIASVRNSNGRPNGTKKRRLDYLFNLSKTPHGRSRIKLLRLRALDQNKQTFACGRVSKIVNSGMKAVCELELADGSKCKMTKDHVLYTTHGWLRLEDLVGFIKVGESGIAFHGAPVAKVAVNGYVAPETAVTIPDGTLAYRNREWLEQKVRAGLTYNEIGHAAGVSGHTIKSWLRKSGLNGLSKSLKLYGRPGNKGMYYRLRHSRTEHERRAISNRMRGPRNHRWRGGITPHSIIPELRKNILVRDLYRCKMCDKSSQHHMPLHIHHIDSYRPDKASNDDPTNLITLCSTCHGEVTGFEAQYAESLYSLVGAKPKVVDSTKKPKRVLKPKFVDVRGIRYCGIQETYDIFMEPPLHNFLANGLVVHNSQESLRYVRPREIDIWLPPDLKTVSEEFEGTIEVIKTRYRDLESKFDWDKMSFEQKKRITSALRRILPDGLATNIIWTANHRTLRWVIEMRTDPSAEVEIRMVFGKVAEICMKDYPILYSDFTPKQLPDGTFQYVPKFSKV
jgi:thymidylate synthase ThyX/5-methylcytosine-specific restriction endonuclease McrA